MAKRIRIKHYYKPTPVKLRKIGDAMMGASTFAATTWALLFDGQSKWAVALCIVGVAGKFITNLFTDETHNQPPSNCDSEPGAQ